jgi:predicted NodU family carbamoyl transferase
MIILGIHGGFTVHQHDPAAALIIDGKVHTVIEEERLLRIKSCNSIMVRFIIKI